jgi:predicted dehydrogenase
MENEKRINVGIIGLGAIGERLIHKFQQHPETRIIAICDTNKERLQTFHERLQESEVYTDYHELLDSADVDLVHIAVPPKFHHEVLLSAVAAGKHVLCEKPLANSYEEAAEMLAAVERAGVVHGINFPLAYSSTVDELISQAASNELGRIKRVELNMQFPVWPRTWQQNPWIAGKEQGGFVREITPHFIEVIMRLFGDVKKVQSIIDYPENGTDCETSIIARAELEDGIPLLVNGLSGIAVKEAIELRLYGDKKTLHFKNWAQLEEFNYEQAELPISIHPNDESSLLISELVKAVKGEKANLVTFKEGLKIQGVLEQLLNRR